MNRENNEKNMIKIIIKPIRVMKHLPVGFVED